MKILDIAKYINKIDQNPYFQTLENVPNVEQFLTSQISFIKAVDHWSKILGYMLTVLPSDKERSVIIENLYDEHGDGNPDNTHVNTFKRFIKSLDNSHSSDNSDGYNNSYDSYDGYNITKLPSYEPIKEFNNRLMSKIKVSSWIYCVCMLGMIEYTYITVSRFIHNYVSNFMNPENINHYSLHEIVDVKHATDLFSLAEPYFDEHQSEIIEGLRYGYLCMDDMYKRLSLFLKIKLE